MTLIKAVEQKSTKGGKAYWRVQLQPGGWASTFDSKVGALCAANVGADLEVTTSKNGDFTNIDGAKAPAGAASAAPSSSRDAVIIREVALKAAVELAVASQSTDLGYILAVAGSFVEWINGDQDPPEPSEVPF